MAAGQKRPATGHIFDSNLDFAAHLGWHRRCFDGLRMKFSDTSTTGAWAISVVNLAKRALLTGDGNSIFTDFRQC